MAALNRKGVSPKGLGGFPGSPGGSGTGLGVRAVGRMFRIPLRANATGIPGSVPEPQMCGAPSTSLCAHHGHCCRYPHAVWTSGGHAPTLQRQGRPEEGRQCPVAAMAKCPTRGGLPTTEMCPPPVPRLRTGAHLLWGAHGSGHCGEPLGGELSSPPLPTRGPAPMPAAVCKQAG